MKKNEVQLAMLAGIGSMLVEEGFKLKKTDKCLVRKINGGRQMVSVPVKDYNPEFIVTIKASVRFDAVQELVCRSEGREPLTYTDTTLTSLEYFYPEQRIEKRFPVCSSEDISRLLDELRPVITTQLLPLFEEWKNLEAVEKVLNWSTEPYQHAGYPARGSVGVAAAYLADPERFEQVVKKYEDEMAALKLIDIYVDRVKATITYLRGLRANAQPSSE